MMTQQTFDFLDASPKQGLQVARESLPKHGTLRQAAMTSQTFQPEVLQVERQTCELETDDAAETASKASALTESDSQEAMMRQLRAKVGCIYSAPEARVGETLSTGCDGIDQLLPRGGLRPDAITEWVADGDGCGAATLAMITAANHMNSPGEIASGRGPLVVVSDRHFYPPAAVALGISAERIIWVRPTQHADLVWSIDQALRCESVAAVWAQVGANLDDRDARRFQLAAETGCTPGLFVRAAATRGRPSFADIRFHVSNPPALEKAASGQAVVAQVAPQHSGTSQQSEASPWGRVMKVTLDRCRGGTVGRSVWVQVDEKIGAASEPNRIRLRPIRPVSTSDSSTQDVFHDETTAVRLASELAHPKTPNRSRRRA